MVHHKGKGKGDSGEVHASPIVITATVLIKLKCTDSNTNALECYEKAA